MWGGGGGGLRREGHSWGAKMVNYYPLIAHSAPVVTFSIEIMPHIVQLDLFAYD